MVLMRAQRSEVFFRGIWASTSKFTKQGPGFGIKSRIFKTRQLCPRLNNMTSLVADCRSGISQLVSFYSTSLRTSLLQLNYTIRSISTPEWSFVGKYMYVCVFYFAALSLFCRTCSITGSETNFDFQAYSELLASQFGVYLYLALEVSSVHL